MKRDGYIVIAADIPIELANNLSGRSTIVFLYDFVTHSLGNTCCKEYGDSTTTAFADSGICAAARAADMTLGLF